MINTNAKIRIHGKLYSQGELHKYCNKKLNNSKLEEWERGIFSFILVWFSESDTIAVQTSGSTSDPKIIYLQKKHMIASAKATLSFFKLKENDSIWLCLPVGYIAGKMMIVRAIVGNLNLIYSKPESNPTTHQNKNVDFAAMVPNQVFEMLASKKGILELQKINTLLIGGSSIPTNLETRLLKNGMNNVWHSYGMTETITHIALRRIKKESKFNFYKLLNNVSIKINSESQLIINAPSLGVKNLLTNDIAELSNDGSFSIIGRKDNVIISGGVKLFPELIEGKIDKLLSNDFFIGSIPDEKLGNKVVLFIETGTDKCDSIDLAKLNSDMKIHLKKYELPRKTVCLSKFLRTETNKLQRISMISKYVTDLHKY